jgi:hypothetical protein
MINYDAIAEFTCAKMLTATHLESVCRYRGFVLGGKKNKAALTEFVAPRLRGTDGVREAMASLETKWLRVLHRIALSQEGIGIRDVFPIVFPERRFYRMPTQNFFKQIADNLLSRGIVCVEDSPSYLTYGSSRFERLVFHVTPEHGALVPDFPASTYPLGERLPSGSRETAIEEMFREALKAALKATPFSGRDKKRTARGSRGKNVADLYSGDVSIEDGEIRYKGKRIRNIVEFHKGVESDFDRGRAMKKDSKRSKEAFGAIRHILAHLPPGQGMDIDAVDTALSSLGLTAGKGEIAAFCELGSRMGIFVKIISGHRTLYRSREAADSSRTSEGGALVFQSDDTGIVVDIGKSSMARLTALACLSHAASTNGSLHLTPSIPLMGRVAETLADEASIKQVRGKSRVFDAAVKDVQRKHRRLLVHGGLQVMRVDDAGLRTMILHRFEGEVKHLEGPYLVAVRSSMAGVEKLIRGEGFVPRQENR